IFSDTDPQQDDLYRLPNPRPAGWLRLWHLNAGWWCLLILSVLTALVALWFLIQPWNSWQDAVLHWLPLLMPLLTVVALVWIRRKVVGALGRVPMVTGSV